MVRARRVSLVLGAVVVGGGIGLVATTGGSSARGRPVLERSVARSSYEVVRSAGRSTVAGPDAQTTGTGAAGGAACPVETGAPGASSVGSATHLFTRTTGDGVTIRVFRLAAVVVGCCPGEATGSASGALSPTTGQISVEMSDDVAVGTGEMSTPPVGETEPGGTEPQAISTGAFGVVEGDPVWWVAFQVGGAVASVQVKFADGSTDEMAPVDGVAAVAHTIAGATATSDPYEVQGSAVLLGVSGNVLDTVTLPAQTAPVSPTVAMPPPNPIVPIDPASQSGSASPTRVGAACPMIPITSTPSPASGVTGPK